VCVRARAGMTRARAYLTAHLSRCARYGAADASHSGHRRLIRRASKCHLAAGLAHIARTIAESRTDVRTDGRSVENFSKRRVVSRSARRRSSGTCACSTSGISRRDPNEISEITRASLSRVARHDNARVRCRVINIMIMRGRLRRDQSRGAFLREVSLVFSLLPSSSLSLVPLSTSRFCFADPISKRRPLAAR